MITRLSRLGSLLAAALPAALATLPVAATPGIPIAPGAALKLAADGFKFTEGPAADASGDVYFTDQPNDRILKWSHATGKVESFLQPSGRANGLYFDRQGKLIVCADEHGKLLRLDTNDKSAVVLLDNFGGKSFNGPNDAWVAPDGTIYFTDPFYKRDYWQGRERPDQEHQRVFRLPPGAAAPAVFDDTLRQPNGIIGSADGKHLFVADIGAGKTYRYKLSPDGTAASRELFCEMGSDGMTLDSAGNLYLTGKGVTVFSPEGAKIGVIEVPKPWTANVTFGGPGGRTLFITAMDAVFTLEMQVSGAHPVAARPR
jgi:gluconolactonase